MFKSSWIMKIQTIEMAIYHAPDNRVRTTDKSVNTFSPSRMLPCFLLGRQYLFQHSDRSAEANPAIDVNDRSAYQAGLLEHQVDEVVV